MTIHMVKLSVGSEDVDDIARWQARYLKTSPNPAHYTRMFPKRAEEILRGGSIYWVVKGAIRVRQRIVDIRQEKDSEGRDMCALIFDPELVRTYAQAKRPFQGWRYLKAEDAPRDLKSGEAALNIPPDLDTALKNAGVW
ncbi:MULTISPECIES: DUF1489 family protein [unclassified Hyphomonas]|jgi:hypothetical protein|uniref:DUF1489 family protein n=1 Tax=unclassified Hyphomonas TaxID=2630699 RepID=UPI000458E9D5|nr:MULTISPECIES: DUF1489 domain-containing protein [unclassified Hyphomonas]KCZ48992.1 hypothetical protein HY17_15035 [Hyphomonas sp. CY54-11-8]